MSHPQYTRGQKSYVMIPDHLLDRPHSQMMKLLAGPCTRDGSRCVFVSTNIRLVTDSRPHLSINRTCLLVTEFVTEWSDEGYIDTFLARTLYPLSNLRPAGVDSLNRSSGYY